MLPRLAGEDPQPPRTPIQFVGYPRQAQLAGAPCVGQPLDRAVAGQQRQVDTEHRCCARDKSISTPPGGSPSSSPAGPRRAPAPPGSRAGQAGRLSGTSLAGQVERALVQAAFAQRLRRARSDRARAACTPASRRWPRPPTRCRSRRPASVGAHGPLEHAGRRTHGVVPVDVAVHLVLGEEQRLERADALFLDADSRSASPVG